MSSVEGFIEELCSLKAQLRRLYLKHLQQHDVQWPGGQRLTGLVYMFYRHPHLVSKDELTAAVRRIHPGSGDYQDGRHLADMGWDICSTNPRFTRGRRIDGPPGHYKLGSAEHPNAIWLTKAKVKRSGTMAAQSWNELLMMYAEHGCAVCGQRFSSYDRGHLDPSKPPELGNIVPMCVVCNQWAQAHGFAFKLFGLVARPVCLSCLEREKRKK